MATSKNKPAVRKAGPARMSHAELAGQVAAISRSQAVIEFTLEGKIITANENFLKTLGYTLEEIKGQHHSVFVDPVYRASAEYRLFWENLARGEFDAGQYKRIGKGGREVWIQASYNPILDPKGKPFKVVKYATDVTEARLRAADFEGQLNAVSKALAVIEFTLEGKVVMANANFLNALGYTLDEIKGQHHSLFVDPAYRASAEYRQFWEKLGRGEFDAGQYRRIGKGGREVWIQASYNPILDMNGRPFKVVKYATDVTAQVIAAAENGRIKSALDKASASVMLADDNLNVIYINESAQALFRDAQADFRRELPMLDADKIVGANIGHLPQESRPSARHACRPAINAHGGGPARRTCHEGRASPVTQCSRPALRHRRGMVGPYSGGPGRGGSGRDRQEGAGGRSDGARTHGR